MFIEYKQKRDIKLLRIWNIFFYFTLSDEYLKKKINIDIGLYKI